MQSYSLTVDKFLDHAARWAGAQEIISPDASGEVRRIGYGALRARANRLSGALLSLGLRPGDRVGTLGWNTPHHLEAYYAVMGAGLVCHTLNPRLTPERLAGMIAEARDRALFASASLEPLLNALRPLAPGLEAVILMDAPEGSSGAGASGVLEHEALLESRGSEAAWGDFSEESPAGLCHTSGTTGPPRGVLYTHRSNYLHTLRALQADGFALTRSDTVLAAVPMFHANGWGLPFAAPAVGARLVLPGRQADGASLARLLRSEGVTVAAGVQTVWQGVLDHLEAEGGELPDLRRLILGGSTCPEALIARLEARLGVRVQTSWGMTELSPLGTVSPPDAPSGPGASGRPLVGLDLKLTDAEGRRLSPEVGPVGRLKVKGASVLDRYYGADEDALDDEGYFDTGDLASLGADGALTLRGRTKELIKSGGEWINPAELEEIVGRDPRVAQVAVIARQDPKWGERPVLVVEPRAGAGIAAEGLLELLRGRIPAWQTPDAVVILEAMPLAHTGKIDKARLRAEYGGA